MPQRLIKTPIPCHFMSEGIKLTAAVFMLNFQFCHGPTYAEVLLIDQFKLHLLLHLEEHLISMCTYVGKSNALNESLKLLEQF